MVVGHRALDSPAKPHRWPCPLGLNFLNPRRCAPPNRPHHARRRPSVASYRGAAPHRHAHPLARPLAGGRSRPAASAVLVGVALAAAWAGIGAALTAAAAVARLDRLGLLAGGVVQIGLDRRGRAAEPARDLVNREMFG